MPGRTRARTAAILVLVAALLCAVILLAGQTVRSMLRLEAESNAQRWTAELVQVLPDIEAVAGGAAPTDESRALLELSRRLGAVYRYRLHAPDGAVGTSGGFPPVDGPMPALTEREPRAMAAMREGRTFVRLVEGDGIREPTLRAQTFVPIRQDERTLAIAEIDLDFGERHAFYKARLGRLALGMIALIALAVAVPGAAFYWRSRQKQVADRRIAFLAHFDSLTRLKNRARFTAELPAALSRAGESGQGLALHYIDIDRFKNINDTLGHDAGDDILRQVARRLVGLAGPGDIVARLGGDEFVICQQPVRSRVDAERFGRHLVARMTKPFRVGGRDVATSVSVGTALACVDTEAEPEGRAGGAADAFSVPAAEVLMKRADMALYRAKTDGRGRHRLYADDMNAALTERLAIEALIRRAIEHDGFELYYQPLFAAAESELRGFEALLRLRDARGRQVAPDLFVAIAEEMGMISRVGRWVLRNACREAAGWPSHISVSVNLSPAQFADGSVVALVRSALAETGLAPERLELEITETVVLRDSEHVLRELEQLDMLGVRVVMDDFGTGYSSLAYLWRFRFAGLKIDRSFVMALDGGNDAIASVIRTIVSLGRVLGMRITAEGVETIEQAERLRALGCDRLQGYLFGRPSSASVAARTIRRHEASRRGGRVRVRGDSAVV
ncbi:MAG: bifunctional diguanylate cyclase/phosphodiesterase [Burkholderiaceae bacterium]